MSSYTQTLYHITFSTKYREPLLLPEKRDLLFSYIWGIIKNKKCHLYRINGVNDHLHILSNLHSTVCLADFIKVIKSSSTKWIKENDIFPGFQNWQDGYGAFTHSIDAKDSIIEYIKNQEEHHKRVSFEEEFKHLLQQAEIDFQEKFLI